MSSFCTSMILILIVARNDSHGFVPRFARRRRDDAAGPGIIGLCAYTRFSDMLGRGRACSLTKVDCVSSLSELVLTESAMTLPSSSSHDLARSKIESAFGHVTDFVARLQTEFDQSRAVENRGEVTCMWFVRGETRFSSDERRSGINDIFERVLIPQQVRSASTLVVCNITQHLVELIWLLLRRLSLVILSVKALTTFFQVTNPNEGISLVRLLGMVAWCEQTLSGLFTFGRFVGVSLLCRPAGDSIGWENPIKALNVVLSYDDDLKLAQLISYNRILIDKSAFQVQQYYGRCSSSPSHFFLLIVI